VCVCVCLCVLAWVCTFLLATFVSERESSVCVCIFVSYVCERERERVSCVCVCVCVRGCVGVCVCVCVCALVARRYEITWRDFVHSCWHYLPEAEFAVAFSSLFTFVAEFAAAFSVATFKKLIQSKCALNLAYLLNFSSFNTKGRGIGERDSERGWERREI
jgi:hypothetical protein